MGVRAADEVGVGQAHQFDVVDVAAFAGNETAVFLAHDACANAFTAHVLSSQRELLFPPFPSKRGGLVFGVACRGYSAACETFMRPAASSTDFTMLLYAVQRHILPSISCRTGAPT